MAEHPDGFVPVKGKWGEQGSTNVRLDAVDEEALGEVLTLAWQNAVPKGSTRGSVKKPRTVSPPKAGRKKLTS